MLSVARQPLRSMCGILLAALFAAIMVPTTPARSQEPLSVPVGDLIASDDFSDAASGWDVSTHSGGRSGYDNGEYRVVAEANGVGVRFGFRSELAKDFVVQVDARLPAGQEQAAVYVGVRQKPGGNNMPGGYVRLTVAPSTGRAVLGLNTWTGTAWTFSPLSEVQSHPAIRGGSETNRIGFAVRDSQFVAYVNGQEILSANDATYTDGGLVLGVIGPRGSETEARFDNLTVNALPAE